MLAAPGCGASAAKEIADDAPTRPVGEPLLFRLTG